MNKYYPVAIDLKGKLALVVGGGKVAQRKVDSLRRTGAVVRVISPRLSPGLKRLNEAGSIEWVRRHVRPGDVKEASVIITATDDIEVNRGVAKWAQEEGVLINVVDNPSLSDFISPAVFRAGPGIITVYTDGRDPVLSRDLKNFLKENWSDFLHYRNRL